MPRLRTEPLERSQLTAGSTNTRVQRVGAYIALTKPRIIELLLVETVPTMFVAKRGVPSVWLMVATLIGGSLAAGGANATNMVIDRDIDALMERTKHRPLVTGVLSPRQALTFALGIETAAFAWLWATTNLLAAVLAVSAFLFYVFVYTLWLKRTTRQNIVIGGAAGAIPVLVGWAAVTNSLNWAPVLLFLVIFFWTPPHFWALAVKYKDDYTAASVPMLPSVASARETSLQIIGYTVVLWVITVGFTWAGNLGWLYLGSAGVLGAVFLWFAVRLYQETTVRSAMRLFGWSITYLTLLFAAMAVDVVVGWAPRF